jgi:hypothetical protein
VHLFTGKIIKRMERRVSLGSPTWGYCTQGQRWDDSIENRQGEAADCHLDATVPASLMYPQWPGQDDVHLVNPTWTKWLWIGIPVPFPPLSNLKYVASITTRKFSTAWWRQCSRQTRTLCLGTKCHKLKDVPVPTWTEELTEACYLQHKIETHF